MKHSDGYRAVSFVFRFMLFSFVLLSASLAAAHMLFPPESVPAAAQGKPRPTVIVDAGHGGRDGGAVAADGTLEKDLNLAVAKMLAEMLRTARVEVIMTRESDVELAAPDSAHKKRDDLTARLEMTRGHENAILVSIHMNQYPVAKYRGLQVYHSDANASSRMLAEQIQTGVRTLDPENGRGVKSAGDGIYLLSHAEIPAVLVECGFLSNETERELLKSEEYRTRLALSLFSSIMTYLENDSK